MSRPHSVLVTGAGGHLGFEILRLLRDRGHAVTGAYRTDRNGVAQRIAAAGATPRRLDLREAERLAEVLAAHDAAVLVPILIESVGAASLLRHDQRAVFFSSNNVAVVPEDPLYARLLQAEAEVRAAAPGAAILRPTMIYGHPDDGNLSRLLRAAARRPVLPRPTGGLQQPVHYRDLAEVAVDCLLRPDRQGATLAVAGPDAVTYAELFAAACRAVGRRRLVLPVPLAVSLAALGILRRMGWTGAASEAQLRRTAGDKRPRGAGCVLTRTPLEEGLRRLAREMGLVAD